jgi:hypothetical protein
MEVIGNKLAGMCVHCWRHPWEEGFLLCRDCGHIWNSKRPTKRQRRTKSIISKSLDEWWLWVGETDNRWYGGGWRHGYGG